MFCSANLTPTQNTPVKIKINRIKQTNRIPLHQESLLLLHGAHFSVEGCSDITAKDVKLR